MRNLSLVCSCLQEIFLKPHLDFTLPRYSVQGAVRQSCCRDGLARLIKDGTSYTELTLPALNSFECKCFQLNLSSRKHSCVDIVY